MNCKHLVIDNETVESDEDDLGRFTTSEIYVCAVCGAQLDGSPLEDRAEALNDMLENGYED